ncbi:MAG: hypothetical protein MUO91_00205 [candidate division Zixibacteria bacterium]|jgi:uncharacterized protein YciU (UPF0263 family)|nr:hypothetical protein [candidate division Zixibacteria bacterium]
MSKQTMSINQIREIGLEVLTKALGPVGMVRFLQQFERGEGDYTKNREKWLRGISLQSILRGIKRKHQK